VKYICIMEVERKSRRKEGKRYRKTFLKLCLGVLAAVVVGSIIYAMFAEFSDSDHLAQAKVEIDLGAEKVEAYANIQVELHDQCVSEPAPQWNLPLPSWNLPVPSISLPKFKIPMPAFISDCWNRCNFSLDCLRSGWQDLKNAFKAAGEAVGDLWLAFLHVINCFSFLWCPVSNLLLIIRNVLLWGFEFLRHMTCRILWAIHSLFDGMKSASHCHLTIHGLKDCNSQFLHAAHKKILGYDAYAEGFGFHFDPVNQKDTLIDILFNLIITGLVVCFFIWAEYLLDSDNPVEEAKQSIKNAKKTLKGLIPSSSSSSSSTSSQSASGRQTPVEA